MQARNQIQQEQDQRGHDERVRAARHRVGQLVAQLHPVLVDPPAVNDRHAVQVRNVVGREEGRAHVADEAANAVHGEDVEGVVDVEHKLELGAVVGEGGAQDAKRNSSPCGDVSWGKEEEKCQVSSDDFWFCGFLLH